MMDYLSAEWQAVLAASGTGILASAWAYPVASAIALGLALLLTRSALTFALVALLLLPGFMPGAGGIPQALALLLGATALSAGFSDRQRRLATERVLQRIALQDARIDAFCAALDQRAGLVDARALGLAAARFVGERAEPAEAS